MFWEWHCWRFLIGFRYVTVGSEGRGGVVVAKRQEGSEAGRESMAVMMVGFVIAVPRIRI